MQDKTNLLLPLKTRRKRFLILGKALPRWTTSLPSCSTNTFNQLHRVISTSRATDVWATHHRFLLSISRSWDIQGLWMLGGLRLQSLLGL